MDKKSRIFELDLMKSFIVIISMIGIHSYYDLTLLDVNDCVTGYVLNILGSQFCAPMFMFCMGVTLSFSRHQSPRNYFKRGVQLLTIGMVLNVLRYAPLAYRAYRTGETELIGGLALIFNVDILQFAGLAFLLLALLYKLKLNHWSIFIVGIGLNITGTLFDGLYTKSYIINQILGYLYPTPTCCCFPLMNWFIFVTAGNVMGWIYRTKDTKKFFRFAIPTGGIVTTIYMYMCLVAKMPFTRALENDWGYYSMHTCDALLTLFGIAPFMLGVFRLLAMMIPEKLENVFSYPSCHINQFYCVSWVWIMWTANLFLFVPKASTEAGFWLAWGTIILLTTITVIIYNQYLKTSLNLWFSRFSTAWIIGIWTGLIAFGFWYFSTVPEPYIMPY